MKTAALAFSCATTVTLLTGFARTSGNLSAIETLHGLQTARSILNQQYGAYFENVSEADAKACYERANRELASLQNPDDDLPINLKLEKGRLTVYVGGKQTCPSVTINVNGKGFSLNKNNKLSFPVMQTARGDEYLPPELVGTRARRKSQLTEKGRVTIPRALLLRSLRAKAKERAMPEFQ